MKKLNLVELVKETEKAYNVTVEYEESNITIWLPKSSARIVGNLVEIKEKFWLNKEIEIISDRRSKGYVMLTGRVQEFEKSFGIHVVITECMSEQTINRMMFFPKSQITDVTDHSFVVPAWLYHKVEQRLIEDNATKSFRSSTLEIEVEKKFID